MRRFGSASGLALAVLAVLGLAVVGAAKSDKQVPFKGTLEGSYSAAPMNPSTPWIVSVQLDATGNATHLGKFTYDFPHVVDRSTVPSIAHGTCTITAANGDQMFADVTGKATLVAPGVLHAVETATIWGGTGRFENASGSYTVDRLLYQATLTTSGSFEGTISSPGASKQ